MATLPVIAIIDVGKTNKKLFLFDQQYRIVYERSGQFTETTDEDGDSCDHLDSLGLFVYDSLHEVLRRKEFEIKAINFSTYGASFVYIDEAGRPLTPLYNYLKPYPEKLKQQFYNTYGGEEAVSLQTASPVLGSLNSGMQLYRLKKERPEVFSRIKYALHLPQYMSYILSGAAYTDITSIGCHTNLWDFRRNDYHHWVKHEGLLEKLAPIVPSDSVVPSLFSINGLKVGVGLHDSSAALIPYLVNCKAPFMLISTGTWCISLNPFNDQPLTADELKQDCLCYLTYEGKPVKASRLFAGQQHEEQVRRIAGHFGQNPIRYRTMVFQPNLVEPLLQELQAKGLAFMDSLLHESAFSQRDLSSFANDEEAYHQLIFDLVVQQLRSTSLVLNGTSVKRIFVDGGFSKNAIYMSLLASVFPDIEVYAASVAQATAIGTALSIHSHWNTGEVPNNLIDLKRFSALNYSLSETK